MRTTVAYIWPFLLLASFCRAQISPGELSEAHKHLEGISNCTQCHELGEKVSDAKCLECHVEIQSLIGDRRGYHASREVRTKECAQCHSEHHGRRFEMIRFDEDDFDHELTGYELRGAHARIDCRQCHQPDMIQDRELRQRDDTYLGLGTACIDCHEDYHQGTLDNDCAKCHTMDEFEGAEKFEHDRTDFALRGEHRELECIDCHQTTTRQGKEFQEFAGIAFENCNACHDDPHSRQLGTNCKQCHTEESFQSRSLLENFNHNTTNFPLRGSHQRVDCASCHNMDVSPGRLFQGRLGTGVNDCASCHEDVHEGKFGTNCAECHNVNSFRAEIDPDRFDHDRTDFALEGMHETVDCRQCHVSESMTEPLPHNTCTSCHEDYHEGAFAENGMSPDCAECHSVEGFSPSLFTIEDHAQTEFPLEGGHFATPCISCHLQNDEWVFADMGTRCVDCHEDVHEGELSEEFYPGKDCQRCHFTSGWSGQNRFDHSLTDFELEGAHARLECAKCHIGEDNPYGDFTDLSADCLSCHEDNHMGQFAREGPTDCRRCHSFESWEIPDFDHSRTDFPLEGKHAEVACAECHFEETREEQSYVVYKIPEFECIDCHR